MEAIPKFILTFGVMIGVGIPLLITISWWVEGSLDTVYALAGIILQIGMIVVGIASPQEWVAGAVIVTALAGVAFFPYAEEQMVQHDIREINMDQLDRSVQALAADPTNVPAKLKIAQAAHEFGLPGHAIAIVEQTMHELSTVHDALHNRSIRDLFRAEEQQAKQWRRELRSKRAFDPVECPHCGAKNYPGQIACRGCNRSYLLELARKTTVRSRVQGKLMLGFCVVASTIVGSVWSATSFITVEKINPLGFVIIGCIIAAAGAILAGLFRTKRLG